MDKKKHLTKIGKKGREKRYRHRYEVLVELSKYYDDKPLQKRFLTWKTEVLEDLLEYQTKHRLHE